MPIDPSDPLTAAAKTLFGVSYLFPYQRLVAANILEAAQGAGDSPGRQIVILPTGAGKSLCFQLPAMLLQGPTLVIYPLLSLMADQERRLRERGFSPAVLRGGQSREERDIIWKKLRERESAMLLANPETLLSPAVLEKLGSLGIVHVVVDEAHCAGEWGESFRPAYLEIGRIIRALSGSQIKPLVTAFTATAGEAVLEKIEKYIFDGQGAHRIIGNPDRSNISYAAEGRVLRDPAVRDMLRVRERPAIVFCSSRNGTEKLARYLRNELEDREIRFYHAGLSREEKTGVETWFFPNTKGVLVSTCAYGMGVDKPDIRTVIHRDCPPSVEAYLQESGRAGRDGRQAAAILLWGPEDRPALEQLGPEGNRRRFQALLDYARNASVCRRSALLELLGCPGDGGSPAGDCCDVCAGTARTELVENPPVADFFRRNRRRYTLKEAAARLSDTGCPGWSYREALRVLDRLLADGVLDESKGRLWRGKLALKTGRLDLLSRHALRINA